MAAAIRRRERAGAAERDVYASYINEAFLSGLGSTAEPSRLSVQLGRRTAAVRDGQRFSPSGPSANRPNMIGRHPRLRFQCFLASRHANQSLCTLARELPNLSLAGYWWHNFFPTTIVQVMEERLDMLPMNKQVGFLLRRVLRRVDLRQAADRAEATGRRPAEDPAGQYTRDDALAIDCVQPAWPCVVEDGPFNPSCPPGTGNPSSPA